jgi:hypothetical protein
MRRNAVAVPSSSGDGRRNERGNSGDGGNAALKITFLAPKAAETVALGVSALEKCVSRWTIAMDAVTESDAHPTVEQKSADGKAPLGLWSITTSAEFAKKCPPAASRRNGCKRGNGTGIVYGNAPWEGQLASLIRW